ncbi:MAG: multicopper oxidase domain-containing protein [Thermoproteota archaeon]|nr:multicopper oxidase domain-containing protein [Thermoproteota archaeon]
MRNNLNSYFFSNVTIAIMAVVFATAFLYQILFVLPVLAQTEVQNTRADGMLLQRNHHEIEIVAEELPDGQIAYRIIKFITTDINNRTIDITPTYSSKPTIPGPTLIFQEGDTVRVTLFNNIGWGMISIHPHGIHYNITSDGTLAAVNGVSDQGATPGNPITYQWAAGSGTVGTWPYHDHTLGITPSGRDVEGLEKVGLFGTLIVNPANGKVNALINGSPKEIDLQDIKKDFILYVTDDAFWGMEIDNAKGKQQIPLWVNPTLVSANNDIVRLHLIALGSDFHDFRLDKYQWLKPGTNQIINKQTIGPLESHVFSINTNTNATYFDEIQLHLLSGMKGKFNVNTNGAGPSIPGTWPLS